MPPSKSQAEALADQYGGFTKSDSVGAYIPRKKKAFTKGIRGQSKKDRAASKVRV